MLLGNSMSSIVGALYASGYWGDSIVSIVKQARWDKLMSEGVSLRDVGVEEKLNFIAMFVSWIWKRANWI